MPRLEPVTNAGRAAGLVWRGARPQFGMLILLMLAGAAAPVGIAWLTRAALDGLVTGTDRAVLVMTLLGVAGLGLLVTSVPHAEGYLRNEMGRRTGLLATDRLYRTVTGFVGLRRHEDPVFVDRLRMAERSTRAPAEIVTRGLGVLRAALTLAGFIVSLAVISPVMTVVVMVTAVPTLLGELVLSRRRAGMLWRLGPTERRAAFYSHLLTSVHAAKEIRLYGIGGFLRERMLAERRRADAEYRRTDRREVAVQGGLTLLAALVTGAGLVTVVLTAGRGELTPGDLSLFLVAVAGLQSALSALIGDLGEGHHQLLLFGHHRAVTAAGPDLPVPARPAPAGRLRSGVEFRDVWFRYHEGQDWALRGVTLRIPAGAAVALVGRNGAGKSTLVKLLCRFYQPTRGAIYWDGVDLADLDPVTLRARIAAIFQDYMEYDLTAAENIGLGDLAVLADRPRLEEAARAAGIHRELERLPRGYDTLLSTVFLDETDRGDPESGMVLSGGQWQRLALARALVRENRDLVVLDEPCAGMDAEAEYRVHAELRRRRRDRTSLLISHRLGTVRDADEIVVLDRGRVVERGDHGSLTAAGGVYAELFRLQASGYQDDAGAGDGRDDAEVHAELGSDGPPAAGGLR